MRKIDPPLEVPVKNGLLGFSDLQVALYDIPVKDARCKVRDECNCMTWCYDRLLGIVPKG